MKTGRIIIGGTGCVLILLIYLLSVMLNPKLPFEKAMLSFRFDDAYDSQREAISHLEEHGLKVSIYCITDFAGTPGYLNWDEIRKLANDGHEIGSHSVTHGILAMLLPGRFEYELEKSKHMLFENTIRATSFAWPYGLKNPAALPRVKAYYNNSIDYPWCSRFRLNGRNTDPHSLMCSVPINSEEFESFLKIAIRKKMWLVTCFHRIGGNHGRFTISIEEFKKMVHCALGMKKKGDVDIVTISEGARFLK